MKEKIIIYQALARQFGNGMACNRPSGLLSDNGCGKFNCVNGKALQYIKSLGATHLWLTGIPAHATTTDYTEYGIPASHSSTVKGLAGSPYSIRDWYDVDPDLAVSVPDRMKEFTLMLKRIHRAGLKLIFDFVPNHVAREYHSLQKPDSIDDLGEHDDKNTFFSNQNNYYWIPGCRLGGEVDWKDYSEFPARATGNDRFSAYPNKTDWYETVKLNYGIDYRDGSRHFVPVPDTWYKMVDILMFWAGKGVDAFRCDMAEMVPVEFWHWAIQSVKSQYPDIEFIAEVYNPGLYDSYINYGGFDWLYDKVGLYDTLRSIACGREQAGAITGCWQRLGECGGHMLHFMENHDEQRIASDFFAGSALKGRAPMIVSALIDKCPVMIYCGQEMGERGMDQEGFSGLDGRTTIFDYWSPDTIRRLYNKGRFDGSLLTEEESNLQSFYSVLLGICHSEKAVTEGKFFDLMYVNPYSKDFDAYKQYAFLRGEGKELLLVVANFSDADAQSCVTIPAHAFDYMEIPEDKDCLAIDLLSGRQYTLDLQRDKSVTIHVSALSGAIIKFIFE